MRYLALMLCLSGPCGAQQPELKTRTDLAASSTQIPGASKPLLIVPAGTRIPLELRQPVSTKTARPGDPIYAQTAFPVIVDGSVAIPAGTWVQGTVDNVKRAGRIKGTAELRFHLTTLIYSNGATVKITSSVDRVPGDTGASVQEPDIIKHDSEVEKDLERAGGRSHGGTVAGALTGAAVSPTYGGFRAGVFSGLAVGTLAAVLARGSDVTFASGTAVEIAVTQPMAIESDKAK